MMIKCSKMCRLCLLANLILLLVNVSLLLLQFDTNPMLDFFVEDRVTASERRLMLYTFDTLASALDKANVTYFMYGGTLIGSIRHHAHIPWDDDLDIIIAYSDRPKAESAMLGLSPEFVFYKPADSQKKILQWKFYSASASSTAWIPKPYGWPFVDIFFYRDNSTHIWDIEPEYHNAGFVWPKNVIFPLTRRPFGSTLAPAPCDSLAFVETNYPGAGSTRCAAPNFNHRRDIHRLSLRSGKTVPCASLWNMFPFVFRSRSADDTVIESLRIGNWTLQTLHVPCVVCNGNDSAGDDRIVNL